MLFYQAMKSTGLIYHPDYLKHLTGFGHPESPDRLTSIMDRLEETGLLKELVLIEPEPGGEEDLVPDSQLLLPGGEDR